MRSTFRKIKGWVIPMLSASWRRVVSVRIPLGVAVVTGWVTPRFSASWRRVVSVRIPLGVAVLVGALIALIILGPELHVERLGIARGSENFAELANKYRATYAQIIGGMFFLYGLYLGWKRVEVAQEGQITERFTRAVDQLGNESLVIRLGGIFALERIARDSEKDHWTVMEVLTAYVRERSPWSEEKTQEEPPPLPTDIQAALTVIGRRKWIKTENKYLDLFGTDLRRADLRAAHLEETDLRTAHLEKTDLREAHLEQANLIFAHLEGANLSSAHLEGATLTEAHMEEAMLYLTHLERTPLHCTYMEGANLTKVHLEGADLRFALGLTREQIELAITDENTKHPDYLKKPLEKEQEET